MIRLDIVLLLLVFISKVISASEYDDVMNSAIPCNRNELISLLFQQGYTAFEIVGFLLTCHNINLSIRQVRRILRQLRHRRNGVESDIPTIVAAIRYFLFNGFRNVGYKTMWKLVNQHFRVRVTQCTVAKVMRLLDAEGINGRLRRRLQRREYINQGPNFLVHIDGNDKLKPFGICIHGAIDGFSRRILWLKVGPSNNNPKCIANFFIDMLLQNMRTPRCIRSDAGTENVIVRQVQMALHFRHQHSDVPSFLHGRSTANQRIEMFWSVLNKQLINSLKNLFKDMRDTGLLDDSDPLHIECLRFCFIGAIQSSLDTFRIYWNTHRIRSQRNNETPSGIPDVLYFQPYLYGAFDHSLPVLFAREDIIQVKQQYTLEYPQFGCRDEFLQLMEILCECNRNDIVQPKTLLAARKLFSAIISALPDY